MDNRGCGLVSVNQRFADLGDDVSRAAVSARARKAPEMEPQIVQGDPIEPFHHHIQLTSILAGVKCLNDIRVAQGHGYPSLRQEITPGAGAACEVPGDSFEGYGPPGVADPRVKGAAPHLAHSAGPD